MIARVPLVAAIVVAYALAATIALTQPISVGSDPEEAHKFRVKCTDSKSPSGGSGATAITSGYADDPGYDDRTLQGKNFIQLLEAQGVIWKVMTVNENGSVGPYSYYKKHESAQREVARILKALSNPKDPWHWWMHVTSAFVEAEQNCSLGLTSPQPSGGSGLWSDMLKQLNPSAPPELLNLVIDALYQPPKMWYVNHLQGMGAAFIARQGGGLLGDGLFRVATQNFYPDTGTPGGVIGEYAQLFAYNVEMSARVRDLYQARIDNMIAGIDYSLDQLQEGINFSEQLEASVMKYLIPRPKSFLGTYDSVAPDDFVDTVGATLFQKFDEFGAVYLGPTGSRFNAGQSESAGVQVTAVPSGFRVTATSTVDPRRFVRVEFPDLASQFDPARLLPGGPFAEEGGYETLTGLSASCFASVTNGAINNAPVTGQFNCTFFPAFLRWLGNGEEPADPNLKAAKEFFNKNGIFPDPLTTCVSTFKCGTDTTVDASVSFFYRADGNHMVYFWSGLPDAANPLWSSVTIEGVGRLRSSTSQDDRVPLRITVSPNQPMTVPVGGTLTLNGTILGKGPVTDVKWRANYIAVQEGGTTLTRTNMRPHHSGYYTLTAKNPDGWASSLPVLVEVKGGPKDNNANLLNLSFSTGELSPEFIPAVSSYTAMVSSNTTSTTVTPRVEAEAQIKVRINGGAYQPVASGAATQPLALLSGTNTVDVWVTASDGVTQKVYTTSLVRVGGTSPTPVITSPVSASARVGAAFSYQITANNSPSSFGATGLPSGLSLNAATGLISGTPTAAGTFGVTLSAGNGSGATTAALTITVASNSVTDTQKPVITLQGSNPMSVPQGAVFVDPGARVTDNVDAERTITGAGMVNTSLAGSYTLNYAASDAAGNAATPISRTVIVTASSSPDNQKPVITLLGVNPMTVAHGGFFVDPGAKVTDDVDAERKIVGEGAIDTSLVGDYFLTYSANDAAGNTATPLTRQVTVRRVLSAISLIPAKKTVKAGKTVELSLLLANDSTEFVQVPVTFTSDKAEVSAPPTRNAVANGKRRSNQRPKVTRNTKLVVNVSASASGQCRITAAYGELSSTCVLTIKP